jgi:hypothetical protein
LEAASQSRRSYEPKASIFYQIPVIPSAGENIFFMSNFVKELVADVGD